MKRLLLLSGSLLCAVYTCGCWQTRVIEPAEEELTEWEKAIKQNYPSYVPPRRIINRRINNGRNVSDEMLLPTQDPTALEASYGGQWRRKNNASTPTPDNDIKVTEITDEAVDTEKKEVTPPPPAAAPEVKKEVKAEAKTDAKAEVKPEVKAEAKTDAKADAKAENKAPAKSKIEPPDPTNSDVYVVKYGDTLGSIAQKFYGDARFANLILKANSDIVKDQNRLKPGMNLIVPKL